MTRTAVARVSAQSAPPKGGQSPRNADEGISSRFGVCATVCRCVRRGAGAGDDTRHVGGRGQRCQSVSGTHSAFLPRGEGAGLSMFSTVTAVLSERWLEGTCPSSTPSRSQNFWSGGAQLIQHKPLDRFAPEAPEGPISAFAGDIMRGTMRTNTRKETGTVRCCCRCAIVAAGS